jgi:RNA polymerase sporulation-specific sigma factor
MATKDPGETVIRRRVEEHRRLVDFAVNRYLKRHPIEGMEREDLVSWGLLGLFHAARAWDPRRGCAFSTLAMVAIERMIARGVRAERASPGGLAPLSLDALLIGESEASATESHLDQIADEGHSVEDQIVGLETRLTIRHAVEELTPEQQWVVRERFYRERTLQEIAEDAGTSRQAIHLREQNILRALRRKLGLALQPAA